MNSSRDQSSVDAGLHVVVVGSGDVVGRNVIRRPGSALAAQTRVFGAVMVRANILRTIVEADPSTE